jgi:hypothetical protein
MAQATAPILDSTAETEIVSRDPEGAMHRSNYGQVVARAKRVANALAALGVG